MYLKFKVIYFPYTCYFLHALSVQHILSYTLGTTALFIFILEYFESVCVTRVCKVSRSKSNIFQLK